MKIPTTIQSFNVTIKEFSQMSGLSIRTLERLDKEGKLPPRTVYPGLRKKLWSRRSVEDCIEQWVSGGTDDRCRMRALRD